ncbi:MAG: hypothetical protein WBM42_00010 [Eudoraea sp.]|uniref:hypothetical protein n=1 Tax=Eudoraea sp. TaxID=1979955 RepID=UPI003C715085
MAAVGPKIWQVLCLVAALSFAAPIAESAEETEWNWFLHAGGYIHFSDDEDYEGPPWFAGVEYQKTEANWSVGLSLFNNSFGDFTQYLYLGKTWHPSGKYPGFRIKLTGGIAHGYEGEHQKIFPIRWGDAWGLALVPTIGYKRDKWSFDVAVLSASGLLFLGGYEFD